MQPEKRDRSRKMGVARARMYLSAHLGWIDGFPVGQQDQCVHWLGRPRVTRQPFGQVTIDRNVLRQAQFTLKKLTRRFPHALPEIVGDVDAWHDRVCDLLEALKRAIHDGQSLMAEDAISLDSLPRGLAAELKSTVGAAANLRPIVQAILWSCRVWKEPREELLRWVAVNCDWIVAHRAIVGEEAARSNSLLLADLVRRDGEKLTGTLQRLLGDDRCFEVPVAGFNAYVRQLAEHFRRWKHGKDAEPPVRPAAELGPTVNHLLYWLAQQSKTTRHSACELFQSLFSTTTIEGWETVWRDLETTRRDHERKLRQVGAYQSRAKRARATAATAVEDYLQFKGTLVPLECGPVVEDIQSVGRLAAPTLIKALLGVLSDLGGDAPKEVATRFSIFRDAAAKASAAERRTDLVSYLRHSREFLHAHCGVRWRCQPWQHSVDAWMREQSRAPWTSPLAVLQSELPNRRLWPIFFEVVAALAENGDFSPDNYDEMAWLLSSTKDVEQTVKLFGELRSRDLLDSILLEEIEASVELQTSRFEFVDICVPLCRLGQKGISLPLIRSLHRTFSSAGWSEVVPTMVATAQRARFQKVSAPLTVLESLGTPPDPPVQSDPGQVPAWAERYPDVFHDSIALIAEVAADPRRLVSSILDTNFRNPKSLENEIEAIRVRLAADPDNATLAIRLQNLSARSGKPPQVSEARRRRLEEKLNRGLQSAVFDQFTAEADKQVRSLTGRLLPSEHLPPDVLSKENLELLAGLAQLKDPYQESGLKLVRKSFNLVDWEPNEESANRIFIEKLRTKGIDVQPWLSPPEIHSVTHPRSGTRLELEFAADSRAVMLMGYYFGTCLSPRNFNFFSAVANAVDVNKHVVYARGQRQMVVGRCLLALSDTGSVVAFHPYCHDRTFPFAEHVAKICSDLAGAMGTVVSHTDRVSPLVGPNWYDDGAFDLGVSLSSASSPLRTAVATSGEENILQVLEKVLSPLGLNEQTLPPIVALPELLDRPELVRPLLPILDRFPDLPDDTQVRAAILAHRSGCGDFARQKIVECGPGYLLRQHRVYGDFMFDGFDGQVVKTLIAFNPTLVLRILRRTREPGVRNDEAECHSSRRHLLAAAHEQLGRTALATKLRSTGS